VLTQLIYYSDPTVSDYRTLELPFLPRSPFDVSLLTRADDLALTTDAGCSTPAALCRARLARAAMKLRCAGWQYTGTRATCITQPVLPELPTRFEQANANFVRSAASSALPSSRLEPSAELAPRSQVSIFSATGYGVCFCGSRAATLSLHSLAHLHTAAVLGIFGTITCSGSINTCATNSREQRRPH
jgi:hypothetical protein